METIEINASFIPLTQNQIAIVDTEDYEYLNRWKWQANKEYNTGKTCYAGRRQHIGMFGGKRKSKNIKLHRVIMDAPKGFVVDHINGEGLDNRKSNLRVVSHRQNLQNQTHRNKVSKYPGISWYKRTKKWVAHIRINGKGKNLGYFEDEREAAKFYEKACRELVGEELICKTKVKE